MKSDPFSHWYDDVWSSDNFSPKTVLILQVAVSPWHLLPEEKIAWYELGVKGGVKTFWGGCSETRRSYFYLGATNNKTNYFIMNMGKYVFTTYMQPKSFFLLKVKIVLQKYMLESKGQVTVHQHCYCTFFKWLLCVSLKGICRWQSLGAEH